MNLCNLTSTRMPGLNCQLWKAEIKCLCKSVVDFMNKSIARDDNDSGVALRQVFGTIHILRKQLWGRGLYKCLFSVLKRTKNKLKTQNMTNPTIIFLVKMEYGWNFSISGLKMMVKSGLEKIYLKFLHAQRLFQTNSFTL